VSRAWSEVLRAEDVLSRAGGDEFVLLLPSTGTDEAVGVLARMSQVVDQPFSAGVARATPLCTVEELLHQADQACYRAKRNGGARVVVAGRAVA